MRFKRLTNTLITAMLVGGFFSFPAITEGAFAQQNEPVMKSGEVKVAYQVYPWGFYMERENGAQWTNSVADFQLLNTSYDALNGGATFRGVEPFLEVEGQTNATITANVNTLAANISAANLTMKSAYSDIDIHTAATAQANADLVIHAATQAKNAGVGFEILVFNPSPKSWDDSNSQKTAAELATQVTELTRIVNALAPLGVVVAIHHHEAPVKNNPNIPGTSSVNTELEYMMEQIPGLTMCLEPTWLLIGMGTGTAAANAKIASFINSYGPRISEIHIRQSSNNGVFIETFQNGQPGNDIDYANIVSLLETALANNTIPQFPHFVMEQFFGDGATNLYPVATAAQTVNVENFRALFQPCTSSLSEIQASNSGLTVFPLPATDAITLSSSKATIKSVQLLDAEGKGILTWDFSDQMHAEKTLDLKVLRSGVYFLDVQFDDAMHEVRKIVVK